MSDVNMEIVSFIFSMGKDFYINLPRYTHYNTTGFNSDSLSVLDLLSIAECATLAGVDDNRIDINSILGVIAYRLKSTSPELKKKATKLIKEMLCFREYNKRTKEHIDILNIKEFSA